MDWCTLRWTALQTALPCLAGHMLGEGRTEHWAGSSRLCHKAFIPPRTSGACLLSMTSVGRHRGRAGMKAASRSITVSSLACRAVSPCKPPYLIVAGSVLAPCAFRHAALDGWRADGWRQSGTQRPAVLQVDGPRGRLSFDRGNRRAADAGRNVSRWNARHS